MHSLKYLTMYKDQKHEANILPRLIIAQSIEFLPLYRALPVPITMEKP